MLLPRSATLLTRTPLAFFRINLILPSHRRNIRELRSSTMIYRSQIYLFIDLDEELRKEFRFYVGGCSSMYGYHFYGFSFTDVETSLNRYFSKNEYINYGVVVCNLLKIIDFSDVSSYILSRENEFFRQRCSKLLDGQVLYKMEFPIFKIPPWIRIMEWTMSKDMNEGRETRRNK